MRAFRSIPTTRVFVFLVLVASMSGCATKGDLRSVRTEIRQLAVRQDSLLTVIERQNRLAEEARQSTEGQLTNLQGNVAQQFRDIEESLERLTELAGQNSRDIAGIRDQLALIGRAQRGAPNLGVDPGVMPGDAAPSASPDTLFETALGQMELGSLGTARRAFEQFLTTYPGHALAPSARFNLADISSQEGRYDEALDGFLEIREDYPADPKVPEALYRAALLLSEQLDREDEAVQLLNTVVNTWPDADEAEMAQQKLDELGR
jgi:tol-pal system protein YbgF